jgi:hypothetical protein
VLTKKKKILQKCEIFFFLPRWGEGGAILGRGLRLPASQSAGSMMDNEWTSRLDFWVASRGCCDQLPKFPVVAVGASQANQRGGGSGAI